MATILGRCSSHSVHIWRHCNVVKAKPLPVLLSVQNLFIHLQDQNVAGLTQDVSQRWNGCFFNRSQAEMPHKDISKIKISPNIEIHKLQHKQNEINYNHDQAKSLIVMFFPRHMASQKFINKYTNLYHSYGLDVLVVKGNLWHFMSFKKGRRLAQQVLDHLSQNWTPLNTTRLLFHSVSFGDYLIALVQNEMKEQPEKYNFTKQKISGQVFDSLTIDVPAPLLQTKSRVLQYLVKRATSFYWTMFDEQRDFHEKVVDIFKKGPTKGNILVFHSFNDHKSNLRSVNELIEGWRKNKTMYVAVSSWPHSVHGHHLHQYPERYNRAIHRFITNLSIIPRNQTI